MAGPVSKMKVRKLIATDEFCVSLLPRLVFGNRRDSDKCKKLVDRGHEFGFGR